MTPVPGPPPALEGVVEWWIQGRRCLLVAAIAAVVGIVAIHAGPVHAGPQPDVSHSELTIEVVRDGIPYRVEVAMLLAAGSPGDVAAARADIAGRFAGGRVVDPGVHAQAHEMVSGNTWANGQASWWYNPTGAPAAVARDARVAAEAGATTWNAAGARFAFTPRGETAATTGGCHGATDGQNTVGWGPQAGNILAITCSWYTGASASEFDMELDPEWDWTLTGARIQVDLQSVTVHEFGHALGLAHSADRSAVMFGTYDFGRLKRVLAADDVAGVTAIYGAGAAQPTSLQLRAGANLVTWPGPATAPERAFTDGAIRAVYSYDPATGHWQEWARGMPAYATSLAQLRPATPYWVLADGTANVTIGR